MFSFKLIAILFNFPFAFRWRAKPHDEWKDTSFVLVELKEINPSDSIYPLHFDANAD
jgi:hypothetical protein